MSSKAIKIMAAVAVVLAVILAAIAYRVSRNYAESANNRETQRVAEPQAAPKVLAVVAVKPLAAYRKIEKDSVALVEVAIAPKDYYTSVDQVVGKEPLADIDGGAPITGRYFAEGNVLAKAIPPGHQAVSVEVSDVIAVGGFVRPGDIVDVLLYLKGNQDEIEHVQARVLLKKTRVLAYQDLIVERPEGLKDEEKPGRENNNRRQRTAVLSVPDADTTRLMLGASLGELRLALHGVIPEGTEVVAVDSPAGTSLPISEAALKAEAAKKVPDKAITAAELSRIQAPPGKRVVRQSVTVYRASTVETVTP